MEKHDSQMTDADYWENYFGEAKFKKVLTSPFRKYYEKYISFSEQTAKVCIEIGALRANNLIYVAKNFGFKPVALDFVDDKGYIAANFKFNGINDFEVINTDFTKWVPEKSFDLVLSNGFVEHFLNYPEIIEKHITLLNDGGLLFLSVPSFTTPFQMLARKIFYKKDYLDKVLSTHNTEIMNKKAMNREILKYSNVIEPLFIDYIHGMELQLPLNQIRTVFVLPFLVLKVFTKIFSKSGISSALFSPCLLVVARRKYKTERNIQ